MEQTDSVEKALFNIADKFSSIRDILYTLPGIEHVPYNDWNTVKLTLEQEIRDRVLRVAVVGAIKSGKSTFINSLLGSDYLKRGAGVVTSIVTRVRRGRGLRAEFRLKSWDEVNEDMREALAFIPVENITSEKSPFDIRREADRKRVKRALDSLDDSRRVMEGGLDINYLVLSSYMEGYARVSRIVSADSKTKKYSGSDFSKYKDFVGDDSLASYLRDVVVEVPVDDRIGHDVEIADCQGSDSTNPLHLVMIQDYLLRTNLIIYVISSRTGIRQADIRFLAMIREMGLLENIFFVVNCDFSEHEGLDNLKSLVDRTEKEISAIRPYPELYTFSSLYDLFTDMEGELSTRDILRLKQWKMEEELLAFSRSEKVRFNERLREKLTGDRSQLLLGNHLERFSVMVEGLRHWLKVRQGILEKDADEGHLILQKIAEAQERINALASMVQDTLEGTSKKSRRKITEEVDRFLDGNFGVIGSDIHGFIRNFKIDFDDYEECLEDTGFSATLYALYKDFKINLERFMAEEINPRLVRFIRDEEQGISGTVDTFASSYTALIRDALERYEETLEDYGIAVKSRNLEEAGSIDMEGMKRTTGLVMPPLISTLKFTARVRSEAVMHLGLYKAVAIMRRVLRKESENDGREVLRALKKGIARIKDETERSILFYLNGYRENLKFQYLFKLNDLIFKNLKEIIDDRFLIFGTDMSELTALVDRDQAVKNASMNVLIAAEEKLKGLEDNISRIKRILTA